MTKTKINLFFLLMLHQGTGERKRYEMLLGPFTAGWSRAAAGSIFFGILILRCSHAAFGILAFKRMLFPSDAVSKLFHQLLTSAPMTKSVSNKAAWGWGALAMTADPPAFATATSSGTQSMGAPFSFMTITWFRKTVGDPAISPAISRFRKPRLASLNNLTSCSLSFFMKPSPLYFSIEPITRALELSVVTASLPFRSGFSKS